MVWWNTLPDDKHEYEHEYGDELRPAGETREGRAHRLLNLIKKNHGVSDEGARSGLKRVMTHLHDDDEQKRSPRDYGFASVVPGHHAWSNDQQNQLVDPKLWEGKKAQQVSLKQPIHASQEFIKPQLVAHNFFHPGKKAHESEPDSVGDPDVDPSEVREMHGEDDDYEGGPSHEQKALHDHSRFVQRNDGSMMLADGHHRVAADMILGKSHTPGVVIHERELMGKHAAADPIDVVSFFREAKFEHEPEDVTSFFQREAASAMLDLYHRTTPEAAETIHREKRMTSKEHNRGGRGTPAFFSNHRDGNYSSGYGEGVVHVRVPEHMAELEDEFKDGEQHYTMDTSKLKPHHFVAPQKTAAADDDARRERILKIRQQRDERSKAKPESGQDKLWRNLNPTPIPESERPKPAKPVPEPIDDHTYSLRDVDRAHPGEGFDPGHELGHVLKHPNSATYTHERVPIASLRYQGPKGKLRVPSYDQIAKQGPEEHERLQGIQQGYEHGTLPPIVVARDGEHHILGDGAHRAAVHAANGETHVPAFVATRDRFDKMAAVTVPYFRNTEKAPSAGSAYGQDIEPHGRYVSERPEGWRAPEGDHRYETGEVTFQNPKHVDFGGGYGEDSNWKRQLSQEHGGRTGRELSQSVRDAGHDGIITHDKYGTSEIVDLTHLKPRKTAALHDSQDPSTWSDHYRDVARARPYGTAINQVHEHLHREAPRHSAPLPDDYQEANGTLHRMLGEMGHPHAEKAVLQPHLDPESRSSHSETPDGVPTVALAPQHWTYGHLAHEAAHLMDRHGRDEEWSDPDQDSHGPDFAHHFSNALRTVHPTKAGADDVEPEYHAALDRIQDATGAQLSHERLGKTAAILPEGISFHFTPSWHPTKPHRISATVPHEDGRKEVGYMEWHPHNGIVGQVHTDPDHRRKGVGSALWQHGAVVAEQHGVIAPQHSDVQTAAGEAWSQKADRGGISTHPIEHLPPPEPKYHDLADHMINEHGFGSSEGYVREKTPRDLQDWHERVQQHDPCTFGKTAFYHGTAVEGVTQILPAGQYAYATTDPEAAREHALRAAEASGRPPVVYVVQALGAVEQHGAEGWSSDGWKVTGDI